MLWHSFLRWYDFFTIFVVMKWRMLIVVLVATLFALLGREPVLSHAIESTTIHSQVETTLTDADNQLPTPLLSGKGTSHCQTNSGRRTVQRTNGKRTFGANFFARSYANFLAPENLYKIPNINILDGIVTTRSFYSLCCLRL